MFLLVPVSLSVLGIRVFISLQTHRSIVFNINFLFVQVESNFCNFILKLIIKCKFMFKEGNFMFKELYVLF